MMRQVGKITFTVKSLTLGHHARQRALKRHPSGGKHHNPQPCTCGSPLCSIHLRFQVPVQDLRPVAVQVHHAPSNVPRHFHQMRVGQIGMEAALATLLQHLLQVADRCELGDDDEAAVVSVARRDYGAEELIGGHV